jgi:hypothetical protein
MSMKKYFNIDIPKRHSQCSHAQEELTPGNKMYSAVFEEGQAFSREDYCSQCWTKLQKEAKMHEAVTFWKSVVPEKKEVKEIFLDRDDKALALLNQYKESEQVDELHQAMILALYLSRRRKLYQRKEITNEAGHVTILFEVPQTQEIIAVQKIDLATIDITKTQIMIANSLKT